MQANWLWGFDQFIGELTKGDRMNQDCQQVIIEEVARIALEDQSIRNYIGHELGIQDDELEEIYQLLEAKLQEEQS